MFHSKKSVSLVAEIMSSTKWLKFKENQESQKNDRPTFVIKWLQKREKFDLIECENSGNADVVPYLWGIETWSNLPYPMSYTTTLLYLTYEELKPSSCNFFLVTLLLLRCTLPMRNWNEYIWIVSVNCNDLVVPYLWGIETWSKVPNPMSYTMSCTLPMRNWNDFLTKNSVVKNIVPYLWEIEL